MSIPSYKNKIKDFLEETKDALPFWAWIRYFGFVIILITYAIYYEVPHQVLKLFSLETFLLIYGIGATILIAIVIFLAGTISRGETKIYTVQFKDSTYYPHSISYLLKLNSTVVLFFITLKIIIFTFLLAGKGEVSFIIGLFSSILILCLLFRIILQILKLVAIGNSNSNFDKVHEKYVEQVNNILQNENNNTTSLPTELDLFDENQLIYKKSIKYQGESGYVRVVDRDEVSKKLQELKIKLQEIPLTNKPPIQEIQENNNSSKQIGYKIGFISKSSIGDYFGGQGGHADKVKKEEVIYEINFYILNKEDKYTKIKAQDIKNVADIDNAVEKIEKILQDINIESAVSDSITIEDLEKYESIKLVLNDIEKIAVELFGFVKSGDLYKIEYLLYNDSFLEMNIYQFVRILNFNQQGSFLQSKARNFQIYFVSKIPKEIIKRADKDDFNIIYNFYYILLCRHAIQEKDIFITKTLLNGLFNFFILNKDVEDKDFKQHVQNSIFQKIGRTDVIGEGASFAFYLLLKQDHILKQDKDTLHQFIFEFFNMFKDNILRLYDSGQVEESVEFLRIFNYRFIDEYSITDINKEALSIARTIQFETIMGLCAFLHNRLTDEKQRQKIINIFAYQLVQLHKLQNTQDMRPIKASWIIEQVAGRVLPANDSIFDSEYGRQYGWVSYFLFQPKNQTKRGELMRKQYMSEIGYKDQIEYLVREMLIYTLSRKDYASLHIDFDNVDDLVENGELPKAMKRLVAFIFGSSNTMNKDIETLLANSPDTLRFLKELNTKHRGIIDQKIINAELDPEKIKKFKDSIREEYRIECNTFQNKFNVKTQFTDKRDDVIPFGYKLLSAEYKEILMKGDPGEGPTLIMDSGKVGRGLADTLEQQFIAKLNNNSVEYTDNRKDIDEKVFALIEKHKIKIPYIIYRPAIHNDSLRKYGTQDKGWSCIESFQCQEGRVYIYDGSESSATINIYKITNPNITEEGLILEIENLGNVKNDILEVLMDTKWLKQEYKDPKDREVYIRKCVHLIFSIAFQVEIRKDLKVYHIDVEKKKNK